MTEPQTATEDVQGGPVTRLTRPVAAIPLLVAFCALIYLPRLGSMPLWDPDEPRYAEVAREMLESGDFVTSRFDYVRYLKKPPLLFWVTAGSFALLGTSEFAARLPCAVAGIATVVVCYLLARSMFGGLAGLLAGGALATSLLHFGMAVFVRFDGPLTLCISLALLLFWLGQREADPRRARRFFLAMYPVLALAMLTKGPVGPGLVGLIIFVYLLVTRNLRLIARLQMPLGVLIFLAVAAPWFLLAERTNPGFSKFFFLWENVTRYATSAQGRQEPVWFFVLVLLGGMLPWTPLLPVAVAGAIRDRRVPGPGGGNAGVLCLVWASVVFVFFSAGSSKLIVYVLPAWPALAVLVGGGLARAGQEADASRRWRVAHLASLAVLLAGVVAGSTWVIIYARGEAASPGEASRLTAMLVPPATIAVASVLGLLLTRRTAGLVLMTAAMGGFIIPLAAVMGSVGAQRSLKPLALAAMAELGPGDTLVAYRSFKPQLCFYGKQRLIAVGRRAPTEFDFDRDGARRAGIWLPDYAAMVAMVRGEGRVVAYAERDDYEQLRSEYGALHELGERGKFVLFSNRPSRRGARGR
ncbi:MAG: glycosyltransferase family 39 protein [Armatimonadota bacterium]|jgi:4-amino-4-deoxy-L-arabinose transferase-like glycosyltransferase